MKRTFECVRVHVCRSACKVEFRTAGEICLLWYSSVPAEARVLGLGFSRALNRDVMRTSQVTFELNQ